MSSTTINKFLKITVSVIFRYLLTIWPDIIGAIISAIVIADPAKSLLLVSGGSNYYYITILGENDSLIFSLAVFISILLEMVLILVIMPCRGNFCLPIVILIWDCILFVLCIVLTAYMSSRNVWGFTLSLGISGIIILFFILVILISATVFSIVSQEGCSGLFKKRKFYYGGLFVKEKYHPPTNMIIHPIDTDEYNRYDYQMWDLPGKV